MRNVYNGLIGWTKRNGLWHMMEDIGMSGWLQILLNA